MNKQPITLDVETTTFQKGNPYARCNRLCLVGIRYRGINRIWDIEYGREPYSDKLIEIQDCLRSACTDRAVLCGFNLKFDLAWLRNYGIQIPEMDVWDCQLAHFIQTNQSQPYPDLDGCLKFHNLPGKLDTVEHEYWANGIDTPEIPIEVLTAYLARDLEGTEQLYTSQLATIPDSKRRLLRLQNQDLLVLFDMEFNGVRFDFDAIDCAAFETTRKITELESELSKYTGNWPHFNFDSGDHLSCLIYGGTIGVKVATEYEHTYKTGPRAGTTEVRQRWHTETKTYPTLCKPIPKTELKKEGYWSTDDQVLRRLSGASKLINLLRERSECVKLLETYYEGFKKTYTTMRWSNNTLHGKFNQVVARTGRLSSSDPNLQNLPEVFNQYIISRY